jgi:trehalose/maltose transport system permease protein
MSTYIRTPEAELEKIRRTGESGSHGKRSPWSLIGKIGFWLLIVVIVFYTLFPFYWAIVSSLKPNDELVRTPQTFWPESPTLANYRKVFADDSFMRALLNSTIVSGSVVILSLLLGTLTAYSMARLNFRGRTFFLYLILSMTMFPGIAIIGSLFTMMRTFSAFHLAIGVIGLLAILALVIVRSRFDGAQLLTASVLTIAGIVGVAALLYWLFPDVVSSMRDAHPYDRLWGLVIVYLSFGLPFTVWVLANFFRAMPPDLEQAALVDGATQMMALRQVLLPMAVPGMVTTGLLTFIQSWSEFLYARTFTISERSKTVQIAIADFTGNTSFEVPFGVRMAAAVVVTVPLLVGVLMVQGRIIAGLTAGAVKG